MIRIYPGKDAVKMYTLVPGATVGITLGRMAKESKALSGGTEYEMLDCIPLSEYDTTLGNFYRINPSDILAETQAWYKNQIKSQLSSTLLQKALIGIDTSLWNKDDLADFTAKRPKTKVTDTTGAIVGTRTPKKPGGEKDEKDEEELALSQIINTIQVIIFEAQWVAYSIECYDYEKVLRHQALDQMFGTSIINAVLTAINDHKDLGEIIHNHLLAKKLAFLDDKNPEVVYDEIFGNNKFKQRLGLVYVSFDHAAELVDMLNFDAYNDINTVILVPNALNGTIPLMLRGRFPNSQIICAEVTDYFT
jgi:hypothetical protein